MTRSILLLLAWPVVWLSGSGLTPHPLHVSYIKLEVEDSTISGRVRVFPDDLARALAAFHHRDTVDLDAADADSLFEAYLRATLDVAGDSVALVTYIVTSGQDAKPKMRWYEFQIQLEQPIKQLGLRSRIFFELYRDQRNLVDVHYVPADEWHYLYWNSGDKRMVTLMFAETAHEGRHNLTLSAVPTDGG
ncbi:MAG: DUF6702 family protein [Gemmatimonadales bacterium]